MYTLLCSSSLSNSLEPYRHLSPVDIPIHAPILATLSISIPPSALSSSLLFFFFSRHLPFDDVLFHLFSFSARFRTNCSSHHWRCSSMSTRRESAAEVMGVTLLALLASNIEDNYRARRQGFYLSPRSMGSRGKTEPGRFLLSPVDIPERSTPDIEPRIGKPCWGQLQLWFEWPRQYVRQPYQDQLVEEEANEEDPMCLPHHSSCRHASPLLFAWFS
jgi:hypothetical protein